MVQCVCNSSKSNRTTDPSHGANRGSNPRGDANKQSNNLANYREVSGHLVPTSRNIHTHSDTPENTHLHFPSGAKVVHPISRLERTVWSVSVFLILTGFLILVGAGFVR
jgi:hypothetical protein